MDLIQKGWFTEFSPDDVEEIKRLQGQSENGGGVGKCTQEAVKDCRPMLKVDGREICGAWTGQALSLAVDEILFSKKSKYQDVLVFKSKTYGNVLVLDGVIQTTDRDEFAYQEMLAHLPLFAHPHPKKVLIIGGGDGGILREVVKHECVESVTMCEIDQMVIDVAKKFLPKLATAFSHPKLDLYVGDGLEFLKSHHNQFDVIITDSSDPVGPAESLFTHDYYNLLKTTLRDDGILSSQAESPWLHLPLIAEMVHFTRNIFATVTYAFSSVPTYPSGSMGYLIAAKSERDVTVPARELSNAEAEEMQLKYYNKTVHRAAFMLPTFVQQAFDIDSSKQ